MPESHCKSNSNRVPTDLRIHLDWQACTQPGPIAFRLSAGSQNWNDSTQNRIKGNGKVQPRGDSCSDLERYRSVFKKSWDKGLRYHIRRKVWGAFPEMHACVLVGWWREYWAGRPPPTGSNASQQCLDHLPDGKIRAAAQSSLENLLASCCLNI